MKIIIENSVLQLVSKLALAAFFTKVSLELFFISARCITLAKNWVQKLYFYRNYWYCELRRSRIRDLFNRDFFNKKTHVFWKISVLIIIFIQAMLLNRFFSGSHFESLKRIYSPGDSIETCFDWFLGDSALRSAKKVCFLESDSQGFCHSYLFCVSQASRCQFTASWRLCRLYSSGRP